MNSICKNWNLASVLRVMLVVTLVLSVGVLRAEKEGKEKEAPKGEAPKGGGLRPEGGGPRGDRPGGLEMPDFALIDTDKSGTVSKEEWVAHLVKQAEERADRSFGFIDQDENGAISEEEMKSIRDRLPGAGGRPRPGGEEGKGKGKGEEKEKKRPELEQ